MYTKYFKRIIDCILSCCAIILLSPLFLTLTIVGAIKMKGNPFFIQMRTGRNQKIFRLIKFRSMTNERDDSGNLLPDEKRICSYGSFLRQTSLDELPELMNICKGDMAIVGPRPLLVKYLPFYTDEERKRHDVRPGLTGYAQIHGRNTAVWEKRLQYDIWYVDHLTLRMDLKVIIDTFKAVVSHEGIALNALEDFDVYRKKQYAANPHPEARSNRQ